MYVCQVRTTHKEVPACKKEPDILHSIAGGHPAVHEKIVFHRIDAKLVFLELPQRSCRSKSYICIKTDPVWDVEETRVTAGDLSLSEHARTLNDCPANIEGRDDHNYEDFHLSLTPASPPMARARASQAGTA